MARRDSTDRQLLVLAVLVMSLVGMAGAANYMYEKASVKGVGYKNVEMIISTQTGFNGAKLVEKESGSGNVIVEKTEVEAERQLQPVADMGLDNTGGLGALYIPIGSTGLAVVMYRPAAPDRYFFMPEGVCKWPTGTMCPMDYINFTKEAEFEYMPVSYQTGTYDQKWIEKLCVQNYRIGAVLTEMYTHAEHLQKSTELKTRLYGNFRNGDNPDTNDGYDGSCPACCTGVLEANLNSNVIGVAHLGWISRDPETNSKGRHNEWGRSVEDLTGVFSIEKFIQLWGNSTCGSISVDWLPCV